MITQHPQKPPKTPTDNSFLIRFLIRKLSNMFLVSLAIADLLVAIFVMPFAIVNDMQVWNKSARFFHFFQSFPLSGSLVVGSHSLQALDQVKTRNKRTFILNMQL